MLRRLAVAAACSLALLLTSAAAAQADARTLVDGPGDMWEHSQRPFLAPDHHRGDILRTVIAHNANQVVLRLTFAQLDRHTSRFVIASRLRTNTGQVRWVRMQAGRGALSWRGVTRVTRADDTTRVDCAVATDIDYAADVAVLRIPRTCLGDPRWIQATVVAADLSRQGVYADNPFNHAASNRLPGYTTHIRRD